MVEIPGTSGAIPRRARRRALLARLREQGFVSVGRIAAVLGVSEMTIRRDLAALEALGLLKRTHGGATTTEDGADDREPPFAARQRANAEAKKRIAREAARLVTDGEVVAIDVGTTTLEVARCLAGRTDLRVFTNSLRAAMTLANGGVTVYAPGGQVRPPEMSLTGAMALTLLEGFHLDRVFLGVSGITADGIHDYSVDDSDVKRMFIRKASSVVVVADASKLDHLSTVLIAPLQHIHVLVTERPPAAPLARALDRAGVKVVLAS